MGMRQLHPKRPACRLNIPVDSRPGQQMQAQRMSGCVVVLTSLGHLATLDRCMQQLELTRLRTEGAARQQAVGAHGQVICPAAFTAGQLQGAKKQGPAYVGQCCSSLT
jgi:hypothetical protein